jgi:hypothetical protein
VFGPAFAEARFHSVGSIGHTVNGDGLQQLLVDPLAPFPVLFALQRDYRLEGLEGLDRSLETDLTLARILSSKA